MRSGSEYVGRTAGEEKEESKENIGFVVEDSKGDRVPFGTRLCWQSLVCYTFIRKPGCEGLEQITFFRTEGIDSPSRL